MPGQTDKLIWNAEQVMDWLRQDFPQAFLNGADYVIEALEPGRARVRTIMDEGSLRPGGTIMGPALMRAADIGCYVLLLGHGGKAASNSATTNLSMSFLRPPEPGDITCEVNALKYGRTLVTMDIKLFSSVSGKLVANAEMTYFNSVG